MKNTHSFYRIGRKLSYFLTVGILAVTSFIGIQTAQAQDWRFDPVFRVGYEYDDNAPLTVSPDASDEIEGYILDVAATVEYATERTTFDITPRYRTRNYDEERFDSDDAFLKLDFNHQGLKSNFRIRGQYADESVRTSERADADPEVNDPDEITGDDGGTVFAFGSRKRLWILPQWSYNFSEKSSIAASVRYTDVDYSDIFPGTYTPYSDVRFEATLTRGFSTRTRGYIRAGAGRFERNEERVGVASEVVGLGLTIGIERGLTQTTRFRAEVGVVETEPKGGESDSDVVWDVNLVRNLETVTLLAQISRSVSGNGGGRGRVNLRDSFNLSVKKRFSERFDGGLGIRAYTTERLSSDPAGTTEDRDYVQLRAQLTYALLRTFSVRADYRYTYRDRSTDVDNADSNGIILWPIWQPTAR